MLTLTYYNKRTKKGFKIDLRRFLASGFTLLLCAVLVGFALKGNRREIIGYTYGMGGTVWEMAQECCTDGVDIRDVVDDIQRINNIKNSVVYENVSYMLPIYKQ